MSTATELVLPERMPTGDPYVGTHHLEAAKASIDHARDAVREKDAEAYIKRAEEHLLYASRHLHSVMGRWREYNARLDRLAEFLGLHEEGDA